MDIFSQYWFMGLVVISIVLGTIGSFLYFLLLAIMLGKYREAFDKDFWVTGVLTGIIERIFFTCIIAFSLSGAAISMVAWITVKAQLHFKVFNDTDGDVLRLYLALLSSIGSLLFALAGGVVWAREINVFMAFGITG